MGIYDDFFYLGGHSILATQILSRVYDVFHVEIPVRAMFSGTFNVAELAKLVEEYQIERAEPDEIAALLEELDTLSDDEIRELLASEGEE